MRFTLILFGFILFLNIFNLISANNEESKNFSTGSRAGRVSLIAFKPFGKNVHVGLNLLLPFVKMPTQRRMDKNGEEKALLTVNTASVTIAGLISGFGLFLAYLLKSVNPFQGREVNGNEEITSGETHSAEHRLDFGMDNTRFSRMLEPVKFVYRNSSGRRVDTTLNSMLNTIEATFLENNIDLSACIQKSLCTIYKRSTLNIDKGNGTTLEYVLDGLSQLSWLTNLLRETAVETAILAGKSTLREECTIKYPTCHWNDPDKLLLDLITKRVKFV